jgi:hypothetical protein
MSNCWIRVRKTDLRKDRGKNEHFMHVKNHFCALNPFDICGHILGDNLDLFRVFGVLYRELALQGGSCDPTVSSILTNSTFPGQAYKIMAYL